MSIVKINTTNTQGSETNVDWIENGEVADDIVFNRPIKDVSVVVNEVIDTVNDSVEDIVNLKAAQTGGLLSFNTYAILDAYVPTDSTQEKSSYKVTNDSDSSLNGYYHWVSGTVYEKDAELVSNVIDENNTSDAVSGYAVSTTIQDHFLRLTDDTSFTVGGYYDTDGLFVSQVAAKYTSLVDISEFDSISVRAEYFGSSAIVLFEADGTTLVQSYINGDPEFKIDLTLIPTAVYVAVCTHKDSIAYVKADKYYNLFDMDKKTRLNYLLLDKLSNYPFTVDITVNDLVKEGILDIGINSTDIDSMYSLTVLGRNVVGLTSVRIYKIEDGVFTDSSQFNVTDYTPDTDIQVLNLTGNFKAQVKVDWSKIPDGTDLSGMTYSETGISSRTYKADSGQLRTNTEELSKLKARNYPFNKDAAVGSVMENSINNITIFSTDLSVSYTLAVLQRNVGGLWSVKIYEYGSGGFGANSVWSVTDYVPSEDIEVLHLEGDFKSDVLIDWSEVPDGTNLTSKTFSIAGISTLTYRGDLSVVDNIPADIVELKTHRYPFIYQDNIPVYMAAGVINVLLYNPNPEKTYSLSVFRKNIAGSDNLWDFKIHESSGNGNYGSSIRWSRNNYTPAANIEQITLDGTGDMTALLTIDWSEVPDGTDYTSKSYNVSGLSIETYIYPAFVIADNLDKFEIILPEVLSLPQGKVLWAYDNCVVKNSVALGHGIFDMYVSSTASSSGVTRNPETSILGSSANHSLTFDIRETTQLTGTNRELETVLSKVISVETKPALTGLTLNTLVIADSYVDIAWGDGIYEYMKQFAVSDSNTVNYKGTRTSYGNLGESYASWSEDTFLTRYVPVATREPVDGDPVSDDMSSPFVFSTDDTLENSYFSFSEYLSSNSISGVDNIVFFLGMNGGDGSGVDTMITNIKATLPSVNIIVCMIPPEAAYRQNSDVTSIQLDRETRNINYLSLFDNRKDDGIYVAPTMASFSRDFGLRNTVIENVQYPLIVPQDTDVTVANNHHPTELGSKVLAETIYNLLLYVNS